MQDFLTRPLLSVWPNGTLLYTGLADGMMIQLSLALMFALVVILPVGLWHVWAYVSPGLRENECKFIWPILIMSPILFVLGAGFAFWVLFPVAFKFFVELNQTAPVPAVLMPAVRDYLGFAIGMLRIFGIAFQLPLVMILLNRIGVLKRSRVIKMRRYAIVAIVVVAAILTPPDIVSQVLLALPMWALFEISVCFMKRD
jgi:sec-independent protein translocase protein TatC